MKITNNLRTAAAMIALLAIMQSEAQTNAPRDKAEPPIIVDKVVANPEKFQGAINVSGRVAKVGGVVGLFALSCEDACFSMPVRFSGTPPKPGSNVVVHGQLTKESNGRYIFNAESVTPKE